MHRHPRSARSFNVRPTSGAVRPTDPGCSSGLIADIDGYCRAVTDDEVIAAALRILSNRLVRGSALTNPRLTREYLAVRFGGLEHEIFACLYLDKRQRVIACDELFRGTLDGASVYPREVVKQALCYNAAAVILAHNHPSGIAEPSQPDELITHRLKEALGLIEVRVLDHFIIGAGMVESMAERGLL